MARINFEDSILSDPRFLQLCMKFGCRLKAAGALYFSWNLAQRWFLKSPHHTIPFDAWEKAMLPDELFEVGFAKKTDSGVYISGSKEHFRWLKQKSDAGKAGGLKTHRISSSARQAPVNVREASSSSSFSKNLSLSEKGKYTSANAEGQAALVTLNLSDKKNNKAKEFISAYVMAYKNKFGFAPDDIRDGKTIGQICNWLKTYPIERAIQLAQVYFQMEVDWFKTKQYDFETFRRNLNVIGKALDTGFDPSKQNYDWNKIFSGEGEKNGT